MTATPRWHEFTIAMPEVGNRAVVDVVVPLLRNASGPGLFFRDLDQLRLITQVYTTDGQAEELAELARDRWPGAAEPNLGTADTVPLAGPVFSGPSLAEATRGFLADVTSALLWVIGDASESKRAALLERAIDIMAAHLGSVSGTANASAAMADSSVPLSFLSFRSHAEAFFVTSRDPAGLRRKMDAKYDAVRERVEPRIAAILAQVREAGPAVSPAARCWSEAVARHRDAIEARFRRGEITAHTEYAADHLRQRNDFNASSFHRLAGSSAQLQDYLTHDTRFLAVRLLTSLLYLGLHSVGISLIERYFLCHVLSRACETLYDVDAVELLASLANRQSTAMSGHE